MRDHTQATKHKVIQLDSRKSSRLPFQFARRAPREGEGEREGENIIGKEFHIYICVYEFSLIKCKKGPNAYTKNLIITSTKDK